MYKLMITEDEPLVRAGLKQYFDWDELGVHSIVEAENGKEGMEVALRERPDLIITDIRMPEMDGLEMIGNLRPKLPDVQFIILTGYNEFTYAQKAIQYGGVHAYLLKPLQYEESLQTMLSCIEKLQTKKIEAQSRSVLEHHASPNGNILIKEEKKSEDLKLFKQIEAFILKHINQELTLSMVAEHFFYNPSYLSRLFKSKLNKNYKTFETEIRIQYAQKCLLQPQFSITDVCNMCGYKSYKHFVKVFKSVTQMTPTEFRREIRY